MPPLLYDPPDLRHYTAGLDPPMSAWPGARDNARRPKPKATRKPRPRSWPSAIVTTETGCGAECLARKTPPWGNVWRLGRCGTAAWMTRTRERAPAGPKDGGQELQRPPAPKRGIRASETLRGDDQESALNGP